LIAGKKRRGEAQNLRQTVFDCVSSVAFPSNFNEHLGPIHVLSLFLEQIRASDQTRYEEIETHPVKSLFRRCRGAHCGMVLVLVLVVKTNLSCVHICEHWWDFQLQECIMVFNCLQACFFSITINALRHERGTYLFSLADFLACATHLPERRRPFWSRQVPSTNLLENFILRH